MRGSARFASNDGTGELIVAIGGTNGGSQPNYKVIFDICIYFFDIFFQQKVVDTDYTSYAIVYSCFEKLFIGKKGRESRQRKNLLNRYFLESLWLLTRDQSPSHFSRPRGGS